MRVAKVALAKPDIVMTLSFEEALELELLLASSSKYYHLFAPLHEVVRQC